MREIADLLGRVFISLIFLYEAYDSMVFFNSTKRTMTEYGLTWNQDTLLITSIVGLLLGGIFVLIGFQARFGASMLFIYYMIVTLVLYSFWDDPHPIHRINAMHFMKNLAIMGGLLIIMVNGSGKYSVKRLLSYTKL
jgi:putative oxidoreductase